MSGYHLKLHWGIGGSGGWVINSCPMAALDFFTFGNCLQLVATNFVWGFPICLIFMLYIIKDKIQVFVSIKTVVASLVFELPA